MSTQYYFVCKAHNTYCSVPLTALCYKHLKDKIQQLKDLARIVKALNSFNNSIDDFESIVVLDSGWKINESSDNLQTICDFLLKHENCYVELLHEDSLNDLGIE